MKQAKVRIEAVLPSGTVTLERDIYGPTHVSAKALHVELSSQDDYAVTTARLLMDAGRFNEALAVFEPIGLIRKIEWEPRPNTFPVFSEEHVPVPEGKALTKSQKLLQAKLLYLTSPTGITDSELAEALGVDRITAYRYRKELGAIEVSYGLYTLEPTPEDIVLAEAILARRNLVI